MKLFKDNTGREWTLVANVTTLRRVRDLAGVNLAQLNEEVIMSLAEDPLALGDVLYVLCKPQADERQITDEQFGRALAGDPINDAVRALMEELVNFCPSPHRRKMLTKAMTKQDELEARGLTALDEYLASGKPEEQMDSKIETILQRTSSS